MTFTGTYTTGQASVSNGATAVTGTGTAWSKWLQAGDYFNAQGLMIEIASITDDTHLTLAENWPGTTLSTAAYKVLYVSDRGRAVNNARVAIDALKVPKTGQNMVFDGSSTASGDPGAGKVRANSASNPTALYISYTDNDGNDITNLVKALDDVVNATSRCSLSFRPTDGANAFLDLNVTGAITDNTTYATVPVSLRAGTVPADRAALAMSAVPSGADGGAVVVTSLTALKALDTSSVTTAILSAAGRAGTWVFRTGDYSAQVTADTQEGVYAKADDTASSSGAWVRAYNGRVDVRWFGATGDGTTDDATAMQAAIDYVLGLTGGGALYVPAGNYKVNTGLNVPGTLNASFHLVGDGDFATAFTPGASVTTVLSVGGASPVSGFRPHFSKFYITSANTTTITGISVNNVSGFVAEDLYYFGLWRGIALANSYAVRLYRCKGQLQGKHCIEVTTAGHAFEAVSCGVFSCGDTAIKFSGAAISVNVKIQNCDLEGNKDNVTFAAGVESLLLTGNYIDSNTGLLWSFGAASTGVVIEGNWLGASASTSFDNITSGRFSNNSVYNQTLTLGTAGASFVDGRGNAALGTGSIPALPSLIGGALGSTDNRVLRADGTGGKTAQGSAVTIDDSGNISGVGTFNGYTPREVLTADRTYYVRTDGSDSNNGLANTSGGAFLTIQKALTTVSALDCSTFAVTIQVGAGTWTQALSWKGHIGSGAVTLQGDTTTPSNAVLSVTSNNGLTLANYTRLTLQGFKLQTTTSGNCCFVSLGAVLTLGNNEFGSSAAAHIRADGGYVKSTTSYTISGGATRHVSLSLAGTLDYANLTVTLSGTPAWSDTGIGVSLASQCSLFNVTMSGSATGKRYTVDTNGVIQSYGAGTASTYFPGNSNGTTATGGQQA